MLSPVSLMCLSVAVVEQNSKSIKQLVHPSRWLSPGKIYWLRQQPGHTGTSSFLCGWPETESHTGPPAWYDHRAEACRLGEAGISRFVLMLHLRQARPSQVSSSGSSICWSSLSLDCKCLFSVSEKVPRHSSPHGQLKRHLFSVLFDKQNIKHVRIVTHFPSHCRDW